jgi:GTP cyclohydrolase I
MGVFSFLDGLFRLDERTFGRPFNRKGVEDAVRTILYAIGDDPTRPGLVETPKRVAKYYEEVFEGLKYTNEEIATKFDKCFEHSATRALVVEKDITAFSMCEHHLALMYDMDIAIGYIPKGRVIGLSKLNRIAQMVAKRPQLQERIGEDIIDVLKTILKTDDIAVLISGKHGCVASRGIKDAKAKTVTSALSGGFKRNAALRAEFMNLIK